MALVWDYINGKPGDIVYQAFEPKNPGKVLEIHPSSHSPFRTEATVQFLNGSIARVRGNNLKDFKSLVDETQKKADNHSARLKAVEALP